MSQAQVLRDKMTGLPNRKGLEDAIKQEIAKTGDEDKSLSVLMMDIDNFKRLNDTLGREAGDEAIRQLVEAMKELGGKGTVPARCGGDQFALVFPKTEREQAFLAAERIRSRMDQPHKLKAKNGAVEQKLAISGGLAAYPVDGQSANEVLRKADEALYRAKTTGRNKVCIAQETKMATKTTHYTITQLERLTKLSKDQGMGEAVLLREALDDLLAKYKVDT